jgi:DNA polymerase I-like protein with 3'-5' exonuclease and polymerase domains
MAFKPGKLISFDTEGTGLDVPQKDSPFAVALCNLETEETWYCEWLVDPETRKPKPNPRDIAFLNKVLGSPRIRKIAHNAPYDIQALSAVGVTVKPPYDDTRIMMKRARSNEYTYELKPLAKKYLRIGDEDLDLLKEIVKRCRIKARSLGWSLGEKVVQDYWLPKTLAHYYPKIWKELGYGDTELSYCREYCIQDTIRCAMLYLMLDRNIGAREREGYLREMALVPYVLDMESTGWKVHPDKVESTRKSLEADIRSYKKEINQHSLIPLDKFTNATLAKLIYDELELESIDGKRSVDREHLEALNHPVANSILGMRDAEGCISKYLNQFTDFSNKIGSELVMFPKFDQMGARTFRFSAKRPPIQTIPDAGKSKSNMSARQCIGPRDGFRWYLIDYDSLQVRIFADRARDNVMRDALKKGVKPHAAAARAAWNGEGNKPGLEIISNTVSLSEYRDNVKEWASSNKLLPLVERRDWVQLAEALLEATDYDIVNAESLIGAKTAYAKAKTLFFLILFGGGVTKASKGLRCSVPEARATIAQYKAGIPKLEKFTQKCIRLARRNGYILTAYDDVLHVDPTFEYRAINYDIQGTEASFVKDRMLYVAKNILPHTPFKLLGQIHDEIGFSVHKSEDNLADLKKIAKALTDHTGHLPYVDDFPVGVDRINTYWNEREEVKL